MKMTVVRTCMLVLVLIVLSTTAVFGQIVYNVGSPNGTPFNGALNYNFAVNREGNSELFPAVTMCANTAGPNPGVPAPGGAAAFDTGDVYTMTFQGSAGNSPVLKTLGTLGASNLIVSQAAAGGAAIFTATAAMVQPPVVGPLFIVSPAVATITLTVTTGPLVGSGINCVTVQGLRFDIGNTAIGAVAGPPVDGTTYGVAVLQTLEGNAPLVPIAGATAIANPANAGLATGMPPAAGIGVTLAGTAGFATAKRTLGSVGATGFANTTGYTTGGTALSTTTAGINLGSAVAANPTATGVAGGVASTIVSVTQNSGGTGSGSVSVQQNTIAVVPGALFPNSPVPDGGGLFRGFTASGPDVTTFLNLTGATTGTQAQIQVSKIPAGATVTFPATVSSSSGLAVWNMALVGSGTLSSPGGTVTYATTINEGTPYSLDGVTAGLGVNIDIPFTVTEAASGGSSGVAQFIVNVGPTTAQGGIPTYSQINTSDVVPSQVLTNVGQFALFRVASNTSARTYPYVLVSGAAGLPSSYDTGVVLENTGRSVSGSGALSNGGQDGTFTIFLVTPSATVYSIASTSASMPNASLLGTGGVLTQGNVWQALASQITTAAGLTGDWKGYVVINCAFPNSAGFAFISQFANPGGGATMGYIAQ